MSKPLEGAVARLMVLVPEADLEIVDRWRAAQRPMPNRSEAIRRLIRLGAGAVVGIALAEDAGSLSPPGEPREPK